MARRKQAAGNHFSDGGYRRAALTAFPYHVLDEVDSHGIWIAILRHDRRHPGYGLRRHGNPFFLMGDRRSPLLLRHVGLESHGAFVLAGFGGSFGLGVEMLLGAEGFFALLLGDRFGSAVFQNAVGVLVVFEKSF